MEATLLGRPHVWEKGDKLYLTTPLTLATPTEGQIEEFAFASAVKSKAPNENIGWLQGRYVEAGRPNLNNAMWLSDELALKSLTPMLMPVTVMHDPRTAVGTIADCKLVNEQAARIDTILAVWKHRFPEVWDEAAANLGTGQLSQSMECFTPWYTCSECAQQYIKLPGGVEQASWCDHLRLGTGRRTLGDVCFTGTGLIFGSRGGIAAYTEASLDHFHDEIAEYHDRAHVDSTYRPTDRSTRTMGLIQIEESELSALRQERNEARTLVDTLQNEKRDLTTKVETAEAKVKTVEGERDAAKSDVTKLTETAQRAELKDKRLATLGGGFLAKLGDTSKVVLNELASKASDEEWDTALKEREELAGVKRDAKPDGSTTPAGPSTPAAPAGSAFSNEEVASFLTRTTETAATGGPAPSQDGATSVRQLARAFGKKTPATPASK